MRIGGIIPLGAGIMEFHPIDINNQEQINCLLELFMDPDVRNYLPQFDIHEHFQDFIHFISMDEMLEHQRMVYLNSEYIGWISVTPVKERIATVELGYAVIASKRGRGYGKQMIEEFVSQCSDKIEYIKMQVEDSNIYSRQILESLNFEHKNYEKQYFYQIPRQNRIS